MAGMDSYGQNRDGAGFRGGLSRYYRPEHPIVRETDREPYDLPDEFLASYHKRGSQRIYHTRGFAKILTRLVGQC